jgi:acetoin utilization protein AcuB
MSATPVIRDYMTAHPFTIGPDQPLSKAHAMMREHHVRHLPVLHSGKLVGIVTDRDLHLVETLRDVDPDQVPVEDAMTEEPYAVMPGTPVAEVAAQLSSRRIGCAVVIEDRKVVGVFTAIDACKLLAELLPPAQPAEATSAPA